MLEEDIAVVGCDDIPLANLISPKLTTLRVDRRADVVELVASYT